MKLTADLISRARVHINALREREIELRGYKIPMIESLGATKDAYDCIDLSDNEIQKFENFPYLTRLTMLLLNNNRITKIEEDLGKSLPHLDTLMLTNNYIASLSEVDSLASFTKVTCLSLLHNPVTRRQHYRFYVIHKLPQLKELDFRKVKPEERIQAEKLFKTNAGKQLEQAINKAKTFTPGEVAKSGDSSGNSFTHEQLAAIEEYLNNASSPEEIDRLEQYLQMGKLPPNIDPHANGTTGAAESTDTKMA